MSSFAHVFYEGVPSDLLRPMRPKSVLRGSRVGREFEEAAPGDFFAWLFDRAGLCAAHYRALALARRLPACLRALGAASPAEGRKAIETRPDLLVPALGAVLLGVTEFCRDSAVFEALGGKVLPQLGGAGRPPKIWSASCSDGPELYSVALLLADAGRLEGSHLLGTDCRTEAIHRAAEGAYGSAALASVKPAWRARYFVPTGTGARIVEPIRSALCWETSDLFAEAMPGPWDLLLWRNLAIYLRPERADEIWRRLFAELRPGGWLVTGRADHPPRDLGLVREGACVYRRRF